MRLSRTYGRPYLRSSVLPRLGLALLGNSKCSRRFTVKPSMNLGRTLFLRSGLWDLGGRDGVTRQNPVQVCAVAGGFDRQLSDESIYKFPSSPPAVTPAPAPDSIVITSRTTNLPSLRCLLYHQSSPLILHSHTGQEPFEIIYHPPNDSRISPTTHTNFALRCELTSILSRIANPPHVPRPHVYTYSSISPFLSFFGPHDVYPSQ
jgi:hypothetical protein